MRPIDRVGIVIKPHAAGIEAVLSDLLAYLAERGKTGVLEEAAALKIGRPGGASRQDVPGQVDLVVVAWTVVVCRAHVTWFGSRRR